MITSPKRGTKHSHEDKIKIAKGEAKIMLSKMRNADLNELFKKIMQKKHDLRSPLE